MASLEVDIQLFSDADFNLSQIGPFANGITVIGSNQVHMQVRSSPSDPTVWAEAGTPGANVGTSLAATLITVTPGPPDTVNIRLPQSILATLPPGSYVYSVIMSSINGTIRQELFRGLFTMNAGPTQWQANTP